MIDHLIIGYLLFVGIGFLVGIWRDRRAHDRELEDQRTRLYKGHL